MNAKRSWKSAWIMGIGVVVASGLLGVWFLPERGRADMEFAKEYPWVKQEGVDAIVSAGSNLPDFEMMRQFEKVEVKGE